MAIITTSGVATFNATSNMNVRISWSESFDTTTITSSKPYGTSTIKITKVEALTKNWYGWNFCPSFWLKFNEKEIYEFTSTYANQSVRLNSTGVWGTILNKNGSIFTTSFTYNRTNTSETRNFTLTKSTTDGWTYPCFYMIGKTSSPTYTNIGGGSSTWTASATLATLYTAPSAPTSIYIATIDGESIKTGNYYYYKHGGKARLYWPAGTPGTNNTIERYRIYVSFKGSSYSATTAYSSNTVTINNNTYYYYDVGGDGDAERGDYQTYKIQAIGKYSNSDLSSATSPRLCKNRLPSEPTVIKKENYIPYNAGEITLSYTAGSDPDKQPVRTYYSEGINSEKHEYNGGSIEVLSNSTTYYLWSYDGLEFSAKNSSVTFTKNDKGPSVTNFGISHTKFTPYQRNNSVNYATNITLNNITTEYGTHSSIRTYNYYARISSDSSFNSSNNIVLDNTSNSNYSFNVSNKITAGYYFKLGVSIVTNLGETSNIKWADNIYCCGTPITSNDFNPTFTITSTINNSRGDISNSSDIAGHFNNFIKIKWTNPNINDTNRFGISKIECGYLTTSSASSFNVVEMQDSNGNIATPSTVKGFTSQIYMYIGDSVLRGSSIIPAIRVTPVNGYSFIKTSNYKKTRTKALEFPSSYSIIPVTWNFFKDVYNEENYMSFSFSGNKILGDTDFVNPKNLNISIKNSLLKSESYQGTYSYDNSGNPGKIIFSSYKNYNDFYKALEGKKADSLKYTTYTISIIDRYGNTASTVVTQTIDFRVAPEWSQESLLTTKIKYLNSDSSEEINSGTSIENRILNPGDEIQLSWTSATDGGNGNSNNIKYIVNCYTKVSSGKLEYKDGTLYFKDTVNTNNYNYKIPSGSSTVKSIYFTIQAEDSSGLTSAKTLSTSQGQALAIGRAVAPDFEVISYNIDSGGNLSGTLSISDFGDSRKINSYWTNYDRIGGLIFEERSASITNKIKEGIKASSYDFPEEGGTAIGGYETYGKQTLTFYLYPTGMLSNISSKIYLFSFEGPTFSYRNHQIGINVAADSIGIEEENGEKISKSVFSVAAANGKDKIYFISNSPVLEDIYLNLTEGKIYNLIIDCGEW